MISRIEKQEINYRSILIKSISVISYAFVFITLILLTAYQFSHQLFKYLIPFFILGLIVFLYRKPFWGLITFVAVLPFHAFLLMVTRNHFLLTGPQAFWIAFWKEALIILLFVIIYIKSLWEKKFPFKIIILDWLILILLGLGVLSAIYGTRNLSQALWGFRTDFSFFLIYFLARSIIKDIRQIKILFGTVLGSGLIVTIFAIFQIYVWSQDFMLRFGYTLLPWTPDGPLQAYQTVGNLIRIISTFSGAIQLGPYLVFLILLSLSLIFFLKSKLIKIFLGLFTFICLFPLYHTFTRSAWLGLVCGLFVLFIILLQKNLKKVSNSTKRLVNIILVLLFIICLIFGIFYLIKNTVPGSPTPTYLDELVLHRGSTPEHWQSIIASLQTIKENPFGMGIGKSGLVTLRFGERALSENWYLQIVLEMGILALIFFIAIIVVFIRLIYKLYRNNKDNFIKGASLGLLVSFVSFSVVGLFLHAWGDNTVLALTFWILAGGLIGYQIKK